jgi:hypothetical protein
MYSGINELKRCYQPSRKLVKDEDSETASVVRVPGYKSRGTGFDFRRCQIL